MIDVVTNGRIRPGWAVKAVDELLKRVKTKPMWEVIDFIVNVFLKKHPEWNKKQERPLKNEFASNEQKDLRLLLSIPPDLVDIIEYFYQDSISYNSKRFWREFAKRYPVFAVPKRI